MAVEILFWYNCCIVCRGKWTETRNRSFELCVFDMTLKNAKKIRQQLKDLFLYNIFSRFQRTHRRFMLWDYLSLWKLTVRTALLKTLYWLCNKFHGTRFADALPGQTLWSQLLVLQALISWKGVNLKYRKLKCISIIGWNVVKFFLVNKTTDGHSGSLSAILV